MKDIPINLFVEEDDEVTTEVVNETPEQALFDVISGKKEARKKEAEDAIARKLLENKPKNREDIKDIVEEVQRIQSQISLNKANALGKDLIKLISSTDASKTEVEKKVDNEIEEEVKDSLQDLIQMIVDKVLDENESEERNKELEDNAVTFIRQFLTNDLFKLLRKQNDVDNGKVSYYKDDPYYIFGGGGDGGGDQSDLIKELEEQLAKCRTYLNVLEKIYTSDVIDFSESPYFINYDVANVVVADATDGPITVRLPNPATNTDRYFIVKKIDTTGNPITVVPFGTETIDGDNFRVITDSSPNSSLAFVTDGVDWHGIGGSDAWAYYFVGELVWADYDPSFEWRDFDPSTQWADLDQQETYRRRRDLL
jgi:hypothetical protein